MVGAIGARTKAFKTMRIDELALQRNGITMEVVDLAEAFASVKALSSSNPACTAKAKRLMQYTTWGQTPETAFDNLVRLVVVLDRLFDEWKKDCMGVRC